MFHTEKDATEDVRVTPSQWLSTLGRYRATVTTKAVASVGSLEFDVTAATVVVPVFKDVTVTAGVRTSVPSPACGQFANGAAWADINGDGFPDLFVTRLGEPARLFVNDGHGHLPTKRQRMVSP